MKRLSKLLALLLALVMACSATVVAAEDTTQTTDTQTLEQQLQEANFDQMTDQEKFQYLLELYSQLHLDHKTKEELLMQVFQSMIEQDPSMLDQLMELIVNTNDPHNHYLTKEQYESIFSSQMFGVGVQVQFEEDCLRVTKLLEGSAKQQGIQVDDQIIAIDGQPLAGLSQEQISSMLQGEENSQVVFTIRRNSALNPIDFTLTRGYYYQASVHSEVMRGVGYIQVTDFTDESTVRDFFNALLNFRQQGIDKLIIDVRDNGGGYVSMALYMINLLVPRANQLICTLHDNEGVEDRYYTSGQGFSFSKVAILVNGNTASSAEIFSGALKDLGIAQIIGTQTYGKARGQQYLPIGSEHYLSVTVSDISLPVTGYYHGVGITPDQVVENSLDHPAVPAIYYFDYDQGNSPYNVQAAKQKLASINYYWDNATTEYDESIISAITIFQNRYGLPETGELDEQTMRTIDQAVVDYAESWQQQDNQLQTAMAYVRS